MQVHGGVDLRLSALKQAPNHRRIPSDEALMRMAVYTKQPLPLRLPTVVSPPATPTPSAPLLPPAVAAAAAADGAARVWPEVPDPAVKPYTLRRHLCLPVQPPETQGYLGMCSSWCASAMSQKECLSVFDNVCLTMQGS